MDVELENGVCSKREIIRHHGAVAVLAKLPDGPFIFVKQFRKPVEQERIEVVAGTLEKGEHPEDCARRELSEETGYEAVSMVHLGAVYPSPGYVDERIEVFHAALNNEPHAVRLDHDEHVQPQIFTHEKIIEMIRQGIIRDSKTLATWLLYEKKIEA